VTNLVSISGLFLSNKILILSEDTLDGGTVLAAPKGGHRLDGHLENQRPRRER
jgi:hypothetical protein